MMRPLIFALTFALLAGVAMALEVTDEPEGLVVSGRGEVSVFSPREDEVWIVAPDDTRGTVTARSGWEVGWLQSPVPALRLKTPAAREWHVLNLDRSRFEVRVGRAGVRTVVLPKQSMIVLKDGSVLGDEEMIPVASDDGLRFKVGTGGRWGVGIEDMAVVKGGIVAMNRQLAMIEPAAGGAVVEEIKKPRPPIELPDEIIEKETPQVPMFGAEPLPRVATPVEKHAAQVEELPQPEVEIVPQQAEMFDPRRVYVPGALVPFSMPDGFSLVDGKVVRVPTGQRMESQINTTMALAEAESRVSSLLEDKPVKPEPEVLPEEHHEETAAPEKEVVHEEHAAEVAEHAAGTEGEDHAVADVSSTVEGTEETETPVADGWLPPVARVATYLPQVMRLQHDIVRAESPQAAMAARRALAQHYLAWQRPQEALVMESLVSPTLPVDNLLAGIALVAKEDFTGAETRLKQVDGTWKDHAALWLAVAQHGKGASAQSLDTWPQDAQDVVALYPLWLRDVATLSHAEALVAVAPGQEAQRYVGDILKTRGRRVTPAWQRMQGLALLAVKDRAGLEPLAAAAEQKEDMGTAYQAKYDFIQALRNRHELENRQMIDYLEALRYEWRGDALEQRVLRELGTLYVGRQDYRVGLERWRTLVQAYPDYAGMAQLTTEMGKAVEEVFNVDSQQTYSPLEYLGLYYDFRELLPDDARGDQITEQVANVLVNEGLYERALPLLEQILKFRTPPTPLDRARIALAYAHAQRLSGAPQNALRILDEYEPDVPNTVLRQSWSIAQAQTLLALERPTDALAALGNMDSSTAKGLRLEAQWQNQNWPQVVAAAEAILVDIAPDDIATDTDAQLALLRQSFAYSQMLQGEKILEAQKRFAAGLEKVATVRDSMTAMAGLNGVETDMEGSDRPLGKFAEALNEINQVATLMQRRRAEHEAEKAEQREYNQKMDYMQLLPPPAL